MGGTQSSDTTAQVGGHAASGGERDVVAHDQPPPPAVAAPPMPRQVALVVPPAARTVVTNAPPTLLERFAVLKRAFAPAIGVPKLAEKWTLLFSSDVHGCSFARLVSLLRQYQGPTLVAIEESVSGGGPGPGRIFGGFNATPWTPVKQRENAARSEAAARKRSDRLGVVHSPACEKPADQAPQFFGDSRCFVFLAADLSENTSDVSAVRIFTPRTGGSLANGNFMYFYDVHPQSGRVGIGMGGSKDPHKGCEGEMAWLLRRNFTSGYSCCGGCPTFERCYERLASETEFHVARVEVWALDDGADESLAQPAATSEEDSVLESPVHVTERALLELHGTKFYSKESERHDC